MENRPKTIQEYEDENNDLKTQIEVISEHNSTIENAFSQALDELSSTQETIKHELNLAQKLQKNIIPSLDCDINNKIKVYGKYYPMEAIGGDFFDYFSISDRTFLCITDVVGHGIPAALVTSFLKGIYYQYFQKLESPSEILYNVGSELYKAMKADVYCTSFLLSIDEENFCKYAKGGHHGQLLLRQDKVITIDSDGIIVGMLEDIIKDDYVEKSIQLEKNDKIFLYTDGILESKNDKGEFFGKERLINLILENKNKSLKETVDIVYDTVCHYTDDNFNDDITIIGIEILTNSYTNYLIQAKENYENSNKSIAIDFFKKCVELKNEFEPNYYLGLLTDGQNAYCKNALMLAKTSEQKHLVYYLLKSKDYESDIIESVGDSNNSFISPIIFPIKFMISILPTWSIFPSALDSIEYFAKRVFADNFSNDESDRLILIANELIDNAFKYSEKGQNIDIKIEIMEQKCEVTVTNSCSSEAIDKLKVFFSEMNSKSAEEFYIERVNETNEEKSGFGLSRVQFETQSKLEFSSENNTISIKCTFEYEE